MKKVLETAPSHSEGSDDEQSISDSKLTIDEPEQDDLQEGTSKQLQKPTKKRKHGIIYLSSIPKYMTVSILREFLSEYAPVGRIYLQASNNQSKPEDGRHFFSVAHPPLIIII